MITIVVEIPHQLHPTVWVAHSDQDIISTAYAANGLVYEHWTLSKAIDCWGEEDDIPRDLAKLLKEHTNIIELGDLSGSDFYNERDAGTELEAAKEVISDDLFSCFFLTLDEAKEFANSYRGHQDIKARIEVKKVLRNT